MPKRITQAELAAVLEGETFINRRMMQIRERIRKGATVEPGELGAATDGSYDFDAMKRQPPGEDARRSL
jgi:hypothetical protein